MDLCKAVGQNIRKHRIDKGLSQEELAFDSGLHRTYISSLERGKRNATIIVLGQISDALNIKPYQLLI
jgi:transcriptional regulator with XRE-family HTH domain